MEFLLKNLKFEATVRSQIDRTQKFVFTTYDRSVAEVAFIDKDDGKNIFCVSCQTACSMGCKFCHTTELRGKVRDRCLHHREITEGVAYAYEALGLAAEPKVMLVSFMGCGEPMLNRLNITQAMMQFRSDFSTLPLVRFAVATMLPKHAVSDFFLFTQTIKHMNMPVKLHLSVHFTNEEQRREWMPAATPLNQAIPLLEWYKHYTGNAAEIHYTLIDGVNDSEADINWLSVHVDRRGIPIKFLQFNPHTDHPHQPSRRLAEIAKLCQENEMNVEFYNPPGSDVGSSCGQFLLDYYNKFAAKGAI